ncbi:MAG: CocE/NonD family hydrolase [Desulfobacteraceae bacterium]|nr:CocE/NonD family hydrolase [Desulfobacteraceae bacterium]
MWGARLESLSLTEKSDGSDDYTADFTHDSRQETNIGRPANRWNLRYLDKVFVRTEKDRKCLTYTSAPVRRDIEVTGHPIVRLRVSSTADTADFFVCLEDVDENGEAYFVTDGMLRANFANTVPNEDILHPDSNIDVLPDLPWHGFRKADYIDGVFKNGSIVELVIDLMPTSWVFKKGHQVRVSIANADWPTFILHPDLSPTNEPGDPNNIIPAITMHRSSGLRSSVELPIVPTEKMKDDKALKWISEQF